MLFSERFGIKYMGDEEWFNPILHQDTLLFIDPFSVFKSQDELFKDSYSEIMYFFQQAFELIAHSGGLESHLSYKKAKNMLMNDYKQDVSRNYIFKEPMRAYSYFALFQYIVIGNQAHLIFDPSRDVADNKVFGAVATSWDTYYPGSERTQNLHNITIKGMKDERIVKAQNKPVEIEAKELGVVDLPLRDNRGVERHLTDLKGKVVLLDFHVFAAKGSTEYIMQLRELYNKYHDRGLEIYMVSLDDNAHFWKEQVANLPWINVYDDTGISQAYTAPAQAFPIIYLIDRGNNIVKNPSQIKNLEQEIERLL